MYYKHLVIRTRTLNQKVVFHKITFIKLSEHKVLTKTAAFFEINFRKTRRGFRTLAKPSIEFFVTITNDWETLNIDKKSSIVDIAGVLDSSLKTTEMFTIKRPLLLFFSNVVLIYNVNTAFVSTITIQKVG